MTSRSDELHWYVAYVRSCCEKKCAELLVQTGNECFLPLKRELRDWSDRRKVVDRVLIPRIVFLHGTERERLESLKSNPYITGYMSRYRGPFNPATVDNEEMDVFMAMVEGGGEKVSVLPVQPAPGDRVLVAEGPLKGRQCELVSVDGKRCIASRLGELGTALIEVPLDSIRVLK